MYRLSPKQDLCFISNKLRPKGHLELTDTFWDLFGEQIEMGENILPHICPVQSSANVSLLVTSFQQKNILDEDNH